VRGRAAGAIAGCLAGFLVGAAFWTYLGVQELTGTPLPPMSPRQGLQDALAPGCTTLALDRHNRLTTAAPCLGQASSPGETLTAELGDRLGP
jgi:hypothetical protein